MFISKRLYWETHMENSTSKLQFNARSLNMKKTETGSLITKSSTNYTTRLQRHDKIKILHMHMSWNDCNNLRCFWRHGSQIWASKRCYTTVVFYQHCCMARNVGLQKYLTKKLYKRANSSHMCTGLNKIHWQWIGNQPYILLDRIPLMSITREKIILVCKTIMHLFHQLEIVLAFIVTKESSFKQINIHCKKKSFPLFLFTGQDYFIFRLWMEEMSR